MNDFSSLLTWGTTALTVALLAWNGDALMAGTLLDLLQTRIDVSMGANVLALSSLMVGAFAVTCRRENTGLAAEAEHHPRHRTKEAGTHHPGNLQSLMFRGLQHPGEWSCAHQCHTPSQS